MSKKGLERIFPRQLFAPVDLNTATNTSDYMSFANYKTCVVVLFMGDGTAGSDVNFTCYQATSSAGAGAKALTVLETGRIYSQYGADETAYEALTSLTKVTQGTAAASTALADTGESVGTLMIELRDTDLDGDNDFTHFRVDVNDAGAAKIGVAVAIMMDPVYGAAPESMIDPAV